MPNFLTAKTVHCPDVAWAYSNHRPGSHLVHVPTHMGNRTSANQRGCKSLFTFYGRKDSTLIYNLLNNTVVELQSLQLRKETCNDIKESKVE